MEVTDSLALKFRVKWKNKIFNKIMIFAGLVPFLSCVMNEHRRQTNEKLVFHCEQRSLGCHESPYIDYQLRYTSK